VRTGRVGINRSRLLCGRSMNPTTRSTYRSRLTSRGSSGKGPGRCSKRARRSGSSKTSLCRRFRRSFSRMARFLRRAQPRAMPSTSSATVMISCRMTRPRSRRSSFGCATTCSGCVSSTEPERSITRRPGTAGTTSVSTISKGSKARTPTSTRRRDRHSRIRISTPIGSARTSSECRPRCGPRTSTGRSSTAGATISRPRTLRSRTTRHSTRCSKRFSMTRA